MRGDAVLAAKVACLREIADLQAQISSDDLDTNGALALIVRRLAELTSATGAAIALRDGQRVICRASYGNAPDVGVQLSDSSLSGECMHTANVILLRDSESDPRVDAAICRQLNFRSLLIVPVLSGGNPAGIAEVLSPNPGNFEGADILVVGFIADLIAGVAVPAESSQAAPVELRTSFEPLLDADLPTPQIAMEVPIPAAPVAIPLPVVRSAEPAIAPVREISTAAPSPMPARSAPAASTAVAAQPAPVPLPIHTPEVRDDAHRISAAMDQQRRLYLAVALIVVLIAIATFAIMRLRKPAPTPQPVPTTTAATTQASPTPALTQPTSTAVVEVPKSEPKKASAAPVHSAKSSSDSHNESATQEVAVRESSPTSSATDAPPDAPSVGQLSTTSSANLAAAIVATNTPTPGLTLPQSRGVVEGKLIRKVLPQYPEMARRSGVGGDVVLSATIGTDGKLKNIRVVSGSPLLREAAISAAKQWRYSPYLLGGKPVETDTHITISFRH
jgi:TonB family protein